MEILDEEWINNFEKTDKLYQDFYLDDIYYTSIHFIYINKNNDIEKIKEENFLMSTPNYINREEIIGLLKRNDGDRKYSILSILKCNITLEPSEITNFLKSTNIVDYNDKFIKPIKNIDAIKFDQTINMFQDLNDLIFIFYEKDTYSDSKNKKTSVNSVTKKVYFNNSNYKKKTIRKQYKDYY
jgi:hypothetical protein